MRTERRTADLVEGCKAQELFSYLLLFRSRPHAREALSEMLWGGSSGAQSKKYLRQTLWQLHTSLDPLTDPPGERIVLVEPDWIRINARVELWLDVEVFEHACSLVQGIRGREIDADTAQTLRKAVELYRGDLLEDRYHDWCLYERERLQNLYLGLLDKLMAYCEACGAYEMGLDYGERILRLDRARERTHRDMMRLQYLSGDRTGALRQYERCSCALREELDVQPSERTSRLYQQIRLDRLEDVIPASRADSPPPSRSLHSALYRAGELREILAGVQQQLAQLQQDINTVELSIETERERSSVR